MRRILTPPLALVASLAFLLTGCAGETPTTPTGTGGGSGGGTGGSCNASITLAASSLSPLAGTAALIRATAVKNSAPVPDGTSILFTTDYGFFLETGLPTVSKLIVSGVADVTLASNSSGASHVKATIECASAQITIQFGNVPTSGPFVSTVVPNTGTCSGGDTVTINGGRFGTNAATTRVTFGGVPATIVSVSDTQIVVKTPARSLANPQVPEAVDIVITLGSGTAGPQTVTVVKGFTYFCVDKRMFISSLSPNSGPSDGGTIVTILGGNFGTNIATTRVTFDGVAASISSQSDTVIVVTTPRHPLANPSIPETVDVVVTRDLGLVSQQSAILPKSFTYRANGTGGPGTCANPTANPGLFISRITPNTGSPDGGVVVTIEGGGFGTTLGTTRVDFGGVPGQVLTVTNNAITVSTPRRNPANPDVPESVDVVVTIDVGGPNQSCTVSVNGFTYTRLALTPVIYSVSPRTGPNDASTRVTIFGTGFQFPEQVFLSGPCGAAKIEATVVSIKSDTIVFLTPIAANGNACLRNKIVTVEVLNPTTGKGATCPDCFKYYDCPSVFGASPAYVPYNQTTLLSINGENFEEPVEATLTTTCAGNTSTRINVTSVSSSIIVVQIPPINPLACGGGSAGGCSNISAKVTITFQSTTCKALDATFIYRVDPVTLSAASPQQLNQDGSPFGTPLGSAPATITVSGSGFSDPMTTVLLKDGAPLAYTQTNNSNVSNPATLTFPAPAIRNVDMNTQACTIGTSVVGTRYVPTSFGIRVTNARTGCFADLPNALIYNPADTTCRSAPIITGPTTLPAGTLCLPYGPVTVTAAGGTPPYTWSASGLPTGLTINALTGQISGTPALSANGPGAATTVFPVTVTATDAIGQTGTRNYSLVISDPAGPFTLSGAASQTIANGTSGSAITPSSTAFPPINWTRTVAPSTLPGTITVTPTGNSTVISVAGGVPAGTYAVVVTGTDSACGTFKHTNTLSVNVTVP